MLTIVISAFLFVAASGAPFEESNIQAHIVGGRNTDISEVPYQVALISRGNFKCGGSIVSPNFIVTAAHCLVNTSPRSLSFRAGSTNVMDGGVVIRAKAMNFHSNYSKSTMDYDVGVVELETPLQFSNTIKAIKLATAEPPDNSSVLVSGWGLLRENGQMSPVLQSVNVPVVNRGTCASWLAQNYNISPRMVCAGVEGKDSCNGDSGGPLAYNGQLVGIVSFGVGCARKNAPGVYTNVANPDITAFIRKYANI